MDLHYCLVGSEDDFELRFDTNLFYESEREQMLEDLSDEERNLFFHYMIESAAATCKEEMIDKYYDIMEYILGNYPINRGYQIDYLCRIIAWGGFDNNAARIFRNALGSTINSGPITEIEKQQFNKAARYAEKNWEGRPDEQWREIMIEFGIEEQRPLRD